VPLILPGQVRARESEAHIERRLQPMAVLSASQLVSNGLPVAL
jgi:hypothetical protein